MAERLALEPAPLEALAGNRGLLQSPFWGLFRRSQGWDAHAFSCRYREVGFRLLVLERPLGLGLNLAYVPHGPEVAEPVEGREELLREVGAAVLVHLPACVFLRFDLPWGAWGAGARPAALATGAALRKAPMDIQPPSTVVVDLAASEEELLAAMKPKTRYNVRLAARKGIRVERGGLEDLRSWYALYRETAQRDRITLHARAYYSELFQLAAAAAAPGEVRLELLLAFRGRELLAGNIVAFRGQEAWYLYGASSSRHRNLMPTYALQWEAMRLARSLGCRRYDLFGIPPREETSHPMRGLYRFKTGFGGRIFNRLGCYDVPRRPGLYRGYRAAEALRALYFRRLRKGLSLRAGARVPAQAE